MDFFRIKMVENSRFLSNLWSVTVTVIVKRYVEKVTISLRSKKVPHIFKYYNLKIIDNAADVFSDPKT